MWGTKKIDSMQMWGTISIFSQVKDQKRTFCKCEGPFYNFYMKGTKKDLLQMWGTSCWFLPFVVEQLKGKK